MKNTFEVILNFSKLTTAVNVLMTTEVFPRVFLLTDYLS